MDNMNNKKNSISKRRILIYAKTYYQAFLGIQLKNTLFEKDDVVMMVSNNSKGTQMFSERVKAQHIFSDVLYVETKKMVDNRTFYDKIRDCVELSFCYNNRYSVLLSSFENKTFDELICFNYQIDTIALYNLLALYNKNVKFSFFEEGLLSYNCEKKGRLTVKVSNMIRKKRNLPVSEDAFSRFYCYYPLLYKGSLVAIQVPRIGINSKTADTIQQIFKPDTTNYSQKYIFFTSVYDFEGGAAIGEYELVCKVADLVGKDNLLVKTHPRDLRTIYHDNGFNVDKNSAIPWEAIQLGRDFSNHVFLTVNSGSVLAGSFMSEKPVKTFYMYKLCNISGNPACRKNARDIMALLDNQSMKDALAAVSIADRLEEIVFG